MKISYENTDEDAVAWNYIRLTSTVAGRKAQRNLRIILTILQALIGAVGYLIICAVLSTKGSLPGLMGSAALAGAFGYGAQLMQFRWVVRRQAKALNKNGHFNQFLGPKEVSISSEGMHTSWAEGETLRRWSALDRVEDAEEHLLFVYGDTEFVILPKRAFRDTTYEKEFVAAVERYRVAAGAVATGGVPSLRTPGAAPWWRNRNSVDTTEENPLQQRRL